MDSDPQNNKKYPEGHFVGQWMAIGIAIFSGLGIPLSIATGNNAFIGLGPAIGIAMGISIGQSIENKHKKEGRIRPLTDKEKQTRKNIVIAGIVLLLLGLVTFVVIYLNR
jgi:hypothetical protein